MQFFKKNFGIKTFILCWILVLLVPNWRQEARWQWQNDQLNNELYGSSLQGEMRKIESIASQNPDDWQARLEALKARQESEIFEETSKYLSEAGHQIAPSTEEVSKPSESIRLRTDKFIGEFESLSRKFPNENDIRKACILRGLRGSINFEPTKETLLSVPARHKLIQCTIEGAKIEPKNSFFPLMEATFLFSLGRDNEGISKVHRAAECEYFDDGTQQTPVRQIELLSRTQNVTWFQKQMSVWWVLFPHLSPISQTYRKAMLIAEDKQKNGDKKAALQIAYDLQRIGATFGKGKQYLFSKIWGRNFIVRSWRHAIKIAGRDEKALHKNEEEDTDFSKSSRLKTVQAFANYARELGRDDIANSAIQLDKDLQKYDKYSNGSYIDDQSRNDFFCLSTIYWLQSKFLKMALVGLICWLVALVFTRKLEFQTLSQRRTLFSVAAFCVGTTVVFFAIGIFFYGAGKGSVLDYVIGNTNETIALRATFENLVTYALLLIWLLPPVILTGIQYVSHFLARRKQTNQNQWKTALLWPLYTIIFVLSNVFFFANSHFDDKFNFLLTYWPTQLLIFLIAILIATIFHIWNSRGKKQLASTLFWGAVWMALLFFYLISFENETITWACFTISIGLFILSALLRGGILVSEGFLLRWKTYFQIPNLFPNFAYRIRVLAAVLCVCTSLSYIVCSLTTLPAVSRMNARIDRQLEIGEIAWLDEQKQTEKKN